MINLCYSEKEYKFLLCYVCSIVLNFVFFIKVNFIYFFIIKVIEKGCNLNDIIFSSKGVDGMDLFFLNILR